MPILVAFRICFMKDKLHLMKLCLLSVPAYSFVYGLVFIITGKARSALMLYNWHGSPSDIWKCTFGVKGTSICLFRQAQGVDVRVANVCPSPAPDVWAHLLPVT
jgi:hypothetical protein